MKNHVKKLVLPLILMTTLFFFGCPQAEGHQEDPVKSYTVTFNSNGGSAVASVTASTASPVQIAPVSEKTNFRLVGWYTDNAKTQKVTFPYVPAANITLYAKWLATENSWVVEFNSTGGTKVTNRVVEKGESILVAPTAPTKADYRFDKWYSDEACMYCNHFLSSQ